MPNVDAPDGDLVFRVDWKGAGKRPDQLVTLLTRALERELGEAPEVLAVTHEVEANVVKVSGLDQLDAQVAKRIAHRARAVYNEFMTSPWY